MTETSKPSNNTQPKSSFWRREPIAIGTLIFTVISFSLTFYYQFWRVDHDVRLSVVNFDWTQGSQEQELSVDILIANYGNQQETFVEIGFLLPIVPFNFGGVLAHRTHSLGGSVGPLISKPGEPILERIVFKIPAESDDRGAFDGRICLRCDFVGPYGSRSLGRGAIGNYICPFQFDRNESGQVFRILLNSEVVLDIYEQEMLYSKVLQGNVSVTAGEPVPLLSPDTEVPAP